MKAFSNKKSLPLWRSHWGLPWMWLWMKSWENGNKNLRQPDAPLALSGVGGLYIWLPHFFVFIASRWEGFPYRTQSQNSSFKTKKPFGESVCHAKARTAGEKYFFLKLLPVHKRGYQISLTEWRGFPPVFSAFGIRRSCPEKQLLYWTALLIPDLAIEHKAHNHCQEDKVFSISNYAKYR